MKKLYILVATLLLFSLHALAQAPQKMSYQAVVRNASNNLVANQGVGMQISILQGSATGPAVYVETQTPITNGNGLVSLEIGTGTVVSGDFSAIDWANGMYFVKTEADPTGGVAYTIFGSKQLLSVPYALYASTSGCSSANDSSLASILTSIDSMSNDIGTMADRIGVMADRILVTNQLIAGLAATMLQKDSMMFAMITSMNSNMMSNFANCCPGCPTAVITSTSMTNSLGFMNNAPLFALNSPMPSYLLFASDTPLMNGNVISIFATNYLSLNNQWGNLGVLNALGLSSGDTVYISVKTVNGPTVSLMSNVLSYSVN